MLAHVSPRRVLVWFGPALTGAAAAILLATGLGLALGAGYGERLGPPPAIARATQAHEGRFHVVALGDSLTAGTGDGAGGYAARVAAGLRRRGLAVDLVNLAIPGDETRDLLGVLGREGALRQLSAADLILVSIGGNDLSHALRGTGAAGNDEGLGLGPVRASAAANLSTILAKVRAHSAAPVRLIGLYNPFETDDADEARARGELLEWNVAVERAALAAKDVLAVPVADLFVGRPDRLAGDHYHPGPAGHELIAGRVLATVPAGEQP
jgi:lysophospholipase L1-like esterase